MFVLVTTPEYGMVHVMRKALLIIEGQSKAPFKENRSNGRFAFN